jgi:small subunit ribosomal protein S8
MMTDPIADMIVRLRNGKKAKKAHVDIPASRVKAQIAKILLDNGYVKNVKYIDDDKQGLLRIYYRYDEERVCAIEGMKRVSLTSRRVYVPKSGIPRVMGGFGIAIISTSKGLMTDKECRALGVGGEVLCHVW